MSNAVPQGRDKTQPGEGAAPCGPRLRTAALYLLRNAKNRWPK